MKKTHCKYGHEFTPDNTYVDRNGYRECKICRRLRTATTKGYGMTHEEYAAMLAKQGDVCAICGNPERGKKRALSIDHDHETQIVRGLLCNACNVGLGRFNDDDDLLEKAVAYLRG